MTSQVQAALIMDHNSKSTKNQRRDSAFNSNPRRKHHKNGRKRSKSFSGGGPSKIKSMRPVLPTKFLLGGNITDPLNLNSLQDEEVNRAMNAVTPKSSPLPTPPRRKGHVEVIIPPNINDPLNLIDCTDDAQYEQQLYSPIKKGRKKRTRKKRTSSGTTEMSEVDGNEVSEAQTPEGVKDSAKVPEEVEENMNESEQVKKDLTLELSPKKEKSKRKSEDYKDNVKKFKYAMDKIVSPVVPQPGAWLKRSNSRIGSGSRGSYHRDLIRLQNKTVILEMPKFKEKDKDFQYGNYNRYYGYRNQNNEIDLRLKCFSHHQHLFQGKDILDIGCNIGHITLTIARDYGARNIVGIDIDKKLIAIARKNVQYYVPNTSIGSDQFKKIGEFYPISMPILYGPLEIPGFTKEDRGKGFPNNVTFVHGNYVLDDETLVSIEQPQFDVILCLSVTKWIHLNWGDTGIKQAFKRMYAQLRPGGKLILEPQNWASYKTKKKLTETIFKHYNSIEFFPEKFTQYLLSAEIGFAKSEILGFPKHQLRGFQRPIQVYTKSTMFPSERSEGPATCNYTSNKVYTSLITPESEYHHQITPTPSVVDVIDSLCYGVDNIIDEEKNIKTKTDEPELYDNT